MSISEIIMKIPWPWWLLIPILSLYYATRGVMEQKKIYAKQQYAEGVYVKDWSWFEKLILLYIQEVLFKVIFTVSGFMTLFTAYYISSSLKSVNEIGAGTAILLIFLFIWGISGISGYLTLLILRGKFPGAKL